MRTIETFLVVASLPVVVSDGGISISYAPGQTFRGVASNPSIERLLELQKIVRTSSSDAASGYTLVVGPAGPTGPTGITGPGDSNLAQTLAIGNVTGGTDLIISNNDDLVLGGGAGPSNILWNGSGNIGSATLSARPDNIYIETGLFFNTTTSAASSTWDFVFSTTTYDVRGVLLRDQTGATDILAIGREFGGPTAPHLAFADGGCLDWFNNASIAAGGVGVSLSNSGSTLYLDGGEFIFQTGTYSVGTIETLRITNDGSDGIVYVGNGITSATPAIGYISATGGTGAGVHGAALQLDTGTATDGNGGDLFLYASNGTGASRNGGSIFVECGGAGAGGTAGGVNIGTATGGAIWLGHLSTDTSIQIGHGAGAVLPSAGSVVLYPITGAVAQTFVGIYGSDGAAGRDGGEIDIEAGLGFAGVAAGNVTLNGGGQNGGTRNGYVLIGVDHTDRVSIGGAATTLGFFAGGPAAKQTVTGAKAGNAALTSLLTALASYGLITDSSGA